MASVTQIVASVKQPYGGYLPMKLFSKRIFDDGLSLSENENIHASLVGLAVDYLTRYLLGNSVDSAFRISCLGADNVRMRRKAEELKSRITGLDDTSIAAACKLVGFDVCYRASISAYKPVESINPNVDTIENIRIMVMRSLAFWREFGPIVCYEPTFEGGYTDTVNVGDGDYASKDTLWDFKVSKSSPTSKHSLQILMYYIMGMHSIHDYLKAIKNLGFFNPRLNTAYLCPVSLISENVIREVESDVICYGCSVRNQSVYTQINENKEKLYTVTDICNMTGLKKSTVYADIPSGVLIANRMGNKYVVNEFDYDRYVKYKKRIRILLTIIMVALMLFAALTVLYMIIALV